MYAKRIWYIFIEPFTTQVELKLQIKVIDPNHDLLISIYRVTYFISLFPCNSSTKTRVVNKFYEACSLGNLPTREYVCEIDSYCNGRIKACNLRYFETFRWLVFGVFFRIFRKNKEYFSSHLTLRENKSEAQRILCNCSDVWSLAPRWGSTTRDRSTVEGGN